MGEALRGRDPERATVVVPDRAIIRELVFDHTLIALSQVLGKGADRGVVRTGLILDRGIVSGIDLIGQIQQHHGELGIAAVAVVCLYKGPVLDVAAIGDGDRLPRRISVGAGGPSPWSLPARPGGAIAGAKLEANVGMGQEVLPPGDLILLRNHDIQIAIPIDVVFEIDQKEMVSPADRSGSERRLGPGGHCSTLITIPVEIRPFDQGEIQIAVTVDVSRRHGDRRGEGAGIDGPLGKAGWARPVVLVPAQIEATESDRHYI